MPDYVAIALAVARSQSLAAANLQSLDYRAIADLCGVIVNAKGESPPDFSWEPTRDQAINELRLDEEDKALHDQLVAYQAKFTDLAVKPAIIVDDTGAFLLFADGSVPIGVIERQWRQATLDAIAMEAGA